MVTVEMLIKMPIEASSEVLKHKGISAILQTFSEQKQVKTSDITRNTHVSWRAARAALRDLTRAGIIIREGRRYRAGTRIKDGFLILNLRDVKADCLFKWKGTRLLLYFMQDMPQKSLSVLAERSGISYRSAKAILKTLRAAGIVRGRRIKEELIVKLKDQTEVIPRSSHRQVVRHFLYTLKTFHPSFDEAVVLFGKASWGLPTLELGIAVLTENIAAPAVTAALARHLASTAENVTSHFGAYINLAMLAATVWLQIKYDMVDELPPSVGEVIEGVCVSGRLPKIDDLFTLERLYNPLPKQRIEELARKRYIEKRGYKYVYSDKALKIFRKKGKGRVTETIVLENDKKIRLIGVKPPSN